MQVGQQLRVMARYVGKAGAMVSVVPAAENADGDDDGDAFGVNGSASARKNKRGGGGGGAGSGGVAAAWLARSNITDLKPRQTSQDALRQLKVG